MGNAMLAVNRCNGTDWSNLITSLSIEIFQRNLCLGSSGQLTFTYTITTNGLRRYHAPL